MVGSGHLPLVIQRLFGVVIVMITGTVVFRPTTTASPASMDMLCPFLDLEF